MEEHKKMILEAEQKEFMEQEASSFMPLPQEEKTREEKLEENLLMINHRLNNLENLVFSIRADLRTLGNFIYQQMRDKK